MPALTDAKEIGQDGEVTSKRRFDDRDWRYLVEYITAEWERRKHKRKDRERQWKEIDRQIAMEPEVSYKTLPNGSIDPKKAWLAEMEMPLQAQALEILTADARRAMFPDTGSWFRAHGQMTDAYLRKVDFQSFVLGDETEVPSQINQDNCDKLIEGFLLDQFRQYDFGTRTDLINAESFKYGMGVGRGRMETKNVYIHEARGTRSEKRKIPVLVPVSIKGLYLDDPMPSMHSAQMLGPAHIAEDNIRLENLILAASKGSTNPEDEDGGWMPKNVGKLVADDNGYVHILEMEGDIVIPRKTTRSMVLPGAIATIAIGGKSSGGDVTKAVIRFRFRKMPFSSYLLFPYHYEHVDDPYPTSPLMKGRPVQMAATDALNRFMNSAALKQMPPVGYDRTDPVFGQKGGPEIYPGALWGTADPQAIKVHAEVGGDVNALMSAYMQHVSLYANLTGILPARLGAQTTSHTTAFAKDAELQRGAVRTIDYVKASGMGPVTRWLDMAYQMGRDALGKNEDITFYIDAYGGFVQIGKDALPEKASFEWFGSGGPAEEQTKTQMMLQSFQLAIKLDQIAVQEGKPSTVNVPNGIKEILRKGGWTDIDLITNQATPAAPGPVDPAVAAIQTLVPRSGSIQQA